MTGHWLQSGWAHIRHCEAAHVSSNSRPLVVVSHKRDQRREACHNYVVATNSFFQVVDEAHVKAGHQEQFDLHEQVRAAITALQDAYVYLTISAGADVRQRAREYNITLYELRKAPQGHDDTSWLDKERETHEARKRLREAMRAELGVRD